MENRCRYNLYYNFLFMFLKYKECQDPLGMENGAISDGQISASSELSADHASTKGRLLLGEGSWLPLKDDGDQWLQIDLRNNDIIVKRVATQGMNASPKWVTSYNLQHGYKESYLQYYMEQGTIRKVHNNISMATFPKRKPAFKKKSLDCSRETLDFFFTLFQVNYCCGKCVENMKKKCLLSGGKSELCCQLHKEIFDPI